MKYPVFIEPGNDDGTLLDAKAVKGGYIAVQSISELNNLISSNSGSIINGSTCYVVNENKLYIFNGTTKTWEESSLNTNVEDLLKRIQEAEATINLFSDRINKNVLNNMSISIDDDNISLNTQNINILNNTTAIDNDILPLVSNSNAGLMSKSDYDTLYSLNSRVSNLEGTFTRLLYVVNDTIKNIVIDDITYERAFYINGYVHQLSEDNTKLYRIIKDNLKNYTATFKDILNLNYITEFNVDFVSNWVSYNKISITEDTMSFINDTNELTVYDKGQWADNIYKTIRFVNGDDLNNNQLIEWLKNNSVSITLYYPIVNNKVTVDNIIYTFSGFSIGSQISRDVNALNINNFVTSILDYDGNQLYKEPFRGISVVIDKTYHIWHYYVNEENGIPIGWQDDGLDTVEQFTNSTAGIIKGSTTDGQIYAESNGTGSVNGWDNLKNRVKNVEDNKAPNILASSTTNGLMKSTDFSKLQDIEEKAQVNILEGVKSNGVLIKPDVNKYINIKQGNNILFSQDEDNSITINANIPDPVTIDDALSEESINPVQNKIVTKNINNKVDKIEGKGLSTEDFTTAEKSKLDTVEKNANYYVLPENVVKDSNYVHTDNNFTNALKSKLDSIAANAQANVIETIKVNNVTQSISSKAVNISVPTKASDIKALPDTTKYANNLSVIIDNDTFIITLQLKDQDGNNLGSQQTIDLPLESLVSSANYYETYTYEDITYNDVIVMILSTSSKPLIIPVADLVKGLQKEITVDNKLLSDLIDDTNQVNLFVTKEEKTYWNNKQDTLTSGTGIFVNDNKISLTQRDIIVNATSIPTASSSSVDFINVQNTDNNGILYRKKVDKSGNYSYEKVLVQDDKTELNNKINQKVSLTGDETINGTKTFSTKPKVNTVDIAIVDELPLPNSGANPTDILTTLTIDGVTYELGGGTQVEANPATETENRLKSIKIDGEDYIIPSGEKGLTLLWTNELPNEAFETQTIYLEISDYDAVILIFNDNIVTTHQTSNLLIRDNLPYRVQINNNGKFIYKDVTVSNFGILFGDSLLVNTYSGELTVDNEYAVPYQIYGLKFVSGVIDGGQGGTNVVANPVGEPTDSLTKLSVNNIIYGIDVGTKVEANPTETPAFELNAIKIAGVDYSINTTASIPIIRRV